MKIDGPLYANLQDAGKSAKAISALGYDGVYTMEGASDPFMPLALACEHAPELEISTQIAVSLPQNPLHLAYKAWDLQRFSNGKFRLGLGSQTKANIERRFGLPFSPVVLRMTEQIQAIKAIFSAFQHGTRLNFNGEYFQHNALGAMFNPGPLPCGPPKILSGGFGPKMCAMAGEHADGLIVHPFNNAAYLQQTVLTNIALGQAKTQQQEPFELVVAAMVVTGGTEQAFDNALQSVKSLLAFYAATPAYKPALEALGFADLQATMSALAKEKRFDKMQQLLPDDLVKAFAIVAEPKDVGALLHQRFSGIASRISVYAPYETPAATWQPIITDFKQQVSHD